MSEKGDKRKKQSAQLREALEANAEKAEAEHKRQLQKRRIEIAQQGVTAFEAGRVGDAVKHYHSYLALLEDFKDVNTNGLHPGLFDKSKDMPEILLVSGVYWDLAKIYDRVKKEQKNAMSFRKYLEKFVVFSKGMPFQPVSAESLRKYIVTNKAKHRGDFNNAYKALGGSSRCFVATSLVDVIAPETPFVLRRLRDERLKKVRLGRSFVAWYYRKGPGIAARMDVAPFAIRWAVARLLDALATLTRRLI